MSQEVGSQKRKGQMQMWTVYEQTVNQQCSWDVLTRLRGNLFAGKDSNSGLTSGFSSMTMRLRMISSWLRNPLQKWTIHFIHLA
jgi:hypothetical protein